MEHEFTSKIMQILRDEFGDYAQEVFDKSLILQYINFKTRSAGSGSKSRSAFANHYALYVLLEDYVNSGYVTSGAYKDYTGAKYTDLLARQRELPFGSKLQNHGLNGRLNEEFAKFFPLEENRPVIRDQTSRRYWINENLIVVSTSSGETLNLANAILTTINSYVEAKSLAFETFIETCRNMQVIQTEKPIEALAFIEGLLQPNVDARLFEIVSFCILKAFYSAQSIFWGWAAEDLNQETLILYKTGRTNANDGGIDFVMKPLGRFFQVTETVNVKKYFLDIDKIQRFPLTFVVKSEESSEKISKKIRILAEKQYPVRAVVDRYMVCIEEIINIPELKNRFSEAVERGNLTSIMNEIVLQCTVEFNFEEDADDISIEEED